MAERAGALPRRNWTEEEVAQALALYLRLDFGKFHTRNPQVMALAARLQRTPGAVALKLTNLAALDESIAQKGMANASATDRRVWQRFLADPAPLLEVYVAQVQEVPPLQGRLAMEGFAERQAGYAARQDSGASVQVMPRIGQAFFREMILTAYAGRCALTGMDDPRLLTASHIVGWQEDQRLRLNPANGLCLNALHDRAFDRHLITFDEDYRMVIAADVPQEARRQLEKVDNHRLTMPSRFLPDQSLLERHRRRFQARAA
jgi:putative restriction endonuclease